MLEWTVAGVLSSDLATQHGVNELLSFLLIIASYNIINNTYDIIMHALGYDIRQWRGVSNAMKYRRWLQKFSSEI